MPTTAPPARPGGSDARPRGRLVRTVAIGLGLTCFASLVFAVSLAATMPAPALRSLVNVPAQVETLSGTVWAGRAGLVGGSTLTWRTRWSGLWRGRLVADAALTGPGTQLEGRLAATPRAVAVEDVRGRAGPGLLALFPQVIVTCDSAADVAVERLSLARGAAAASGGATLTAGTCTYPSGRTLDVPALQLALGTTGDDASAALTRQDDGTALARIDVLGERRLLVRVEPAGAQLIPGMPSSAPTMLELPF